jgi:toxin ParE1/3/4
VKFIIQSAARDDILRQYRYYLMEKEAEAVAEKFLAAVQDTLQQITRRPGIGAPKSLRHPALRGLRSASIRGFPAIRVYYLSSEKGVRILRVLHGKRDILSILEDETAGSS